MTTLSADDIFNSAWAAGGQRHTPEQILAGIYPDEETAGAHFTEEPDPLGGLETEPPPLDIAKALPAGLAAFVQAVADHLEIPVEAAAFTALAALSIASVGRYRVDGGGGWTQPLILWFASGLLPGERKSDLVRIMGGPLRLREQGLIEAHKATQREADRDRDLIEANIHTIKEQLRKKSRHSTILEADLEVEQKKLEALPDKDAAPPRVLIEDSTPEALSLRLSENNEALGVLTAEGGIFQIIAGKYNGDPVFELYLKCYDEEYIPYDRVGRGTIILRHPALAMGLCIQPDVIHKVAAIPTARERGFLGRWFYTIPKSKLGFRKNLRLPLDPGYLVWWSEVLTRVVDVKARQDPPPLLALSPAADQLLQELLNGIEPHLEETLGRFAYMSDWASKLAGKVLRLAGLFHLAQGYTEHRPVDAATMTQAVAFGLWAITQAERIYKGWQRAEASAGVAPILTWMRKKKPDTFTATQLKSSLRNAEWYSTEARDAALVELHHARWLVSVVQYDSQGRRRPTCMYMPNPALWRQR